MIPRPPQARELWALALLVLVTLVIRCIEITTNLETDEIFSLLLVRKPFDGFIDGALADRPHPPLHLLMLRGWLTVFGESIVSIRALSIACSCGFIVVAWALARRIATVPFAFVALGLLAVSPVFNYFGLLGRPYGLIMGLGSLNLLLFVRALEQPEHRGRWLAWAGSCVLLFHAQYIGVLVVGVEIGVALWVLRSRVVVPMLLGLAAIASLVPWIAAALSTLPEAGSDPLDLIAWMTMPTSLEFAMVYSGTLGANVLLGARTLAAVFALTIAAGYGLLWWRNRLDVTRVLLLLVAICVPLCVFFVALVLNKPVFAQRQLIIAVFAFVLVVVAALDALPRALGWSAAAVIFVCTALTLPSGFPKAWNAPWIEITTYLDDVHAGEPIQSPDPWVTAPLQFYRRSAPVYGPTATGPTTSGDASLLVCRPRDCPKERFGTDFEELKVWRWGQFNQRELHLYRFVPNTKRE